MQIVLAQEHSYKRFFKRGQEGAQKFPLMSANAYEVTVRNGTIVTEERTFRADEIGRTKSLRTWDEIT